MSTSNSRAHSRPGSFSLFLAGLLLFAVCGAVLAAPDEERSSISRHHATGGRDKATISSESTEEYDSLTTSGSRSKENTRGGTAKPGAGSASSQSAGFDFWIFDADVDLFNDDDRDGYYHGIDLLFDADTIYSAAEVYAVVYLSLDYGPWNEYGITEDFCDL